MAKSGNAVDVDAKLLGIDVDNFRWDLWEKALETFETGLNEQLEKKNIPVKIMIPKDTSWYRKVGRFGIMAAIKEIE